ncbi:MAG: 2'-5' RNA ligase family protein [Anaerolineales bacterium]
MPELSRSDQQSRYLLMIPLPRAVAVRIEDRFLPKLGATRPAMGYHISLVGPFFWVDQMTDNTLERLQRACARAKPLQLTISGLDVFENAPDDCGVFLNVHPLGPVRQLYEQMLAALSDDITLQYHRAGPYRPHITIGLNLPSQVCQSLRNSVVTPFHARFCANELWLMEQPPMSPWLPLLALSLGSAKPPRALSRERADG